MTNINLPAIQGQAPSFALAASEQQSQVMHDLAGGLGGRTKNIISIMGNRFTLKNEDGSDHQPLLQDQMTGALYLDVALVAAVPSVSRRFWAATYSSDNSGPPTCFSIDGNVPAGPTGARVHTDCEGCPKNVVGSAITADNRQTRACGFFKRICVAPLDNPGMIYAMDLNSMSIFGKEPNNLGMKFGMYANALAAKKLNPMAVVTRMYIVPGQQSPSVLFTAVGYLEQQQFEAVAAAATQAEVEKNLGFTDEVRGAQTDGAAQQQTPSPDQQQIAQQQVQQPAQQQQVQQPVQQQVQQPVQQQPVQQPVQQQVQQPVQQQVQQPAIDPQAQASAQAAMQQNPMPQQQVQQPVQQPVQQQVQQPVQQQVQQPMQQAQQPVHQQVQQQVQQPAADMGMGGLPADLTAILDEVAG